MHAGREPKAPLRILIIGGAGAFGSRLARFLAGLEGTELLIGGRSLPRSEALAEELRSNHPGAAIGALFVDRDEALEPTLNEQRIDLVIDAAGPFQGHDYGTAQAALASGAHYLDLADARDFVLGFDRLDAQARREHLVALTGASSVPALSSAVVGALARDLTLAEIRIAILPGAGAPHGKSVVSAILSQAGQRSERRVAGEWRSVYGWQDLRRYRLQIGKRRIGRWASHCDVPDLDGLGRLYPSVDTITFHAGIEPWPLHFGLWLLSWLVRWRRINNLAAYADTLAPIARRIDRSRGRAGGMLVEVVGYDREGRWLRRTWTLIAPVGVGPMIPAMPAALLTQGIVAGAIPAGARAAYQILPLISFEPLFAEHKIATETVECALPDPVFKQVLGERFAELPAPIRAVHNRHVPLVAEGDASINVGTHPIARILARLARLPLNSEGVPVRVEITPRQSAEIWRRIFGKGSFKSRLRVSGTKAKRLFERFGPFEFEIELKPDGKRLNYIVKRGRFVGIPLPRALMPQVTAFEHLDEDRFAFDVRVEVPFIGLLAHYAGWLVPVQHAGPASAGANREARLAVSADPTWPY